MLQLYLPDKEFWDPEKSEFIYVRGQSLQLEHSLISISKWESKWEKAFLGRREKTPEESLDYIRCMTINKNVDPMIYQSITDDSVLLINQYISAPMTATFFKKDPSATQNRDTITSELIYYWMISLNIPFECQKWHLNRLLSLIHVCSIKNSPPKKMSQKEIMMQNDAINEARKKQLNTNG